MSRIPVRALPANFDKALYETSRLQVVGIAIDDWWVTAGLIYGYPDSSQYPNRQYMNEVLVDEIIQRVVYQTAGPRLVAGDFNQGPHDLEQFSLLREAGFREIQEIGLLQWGRSVQPTCGGNKNIDQIWLSPELQGLLIDYHIRSEDWAGHSALQCVFASQTTPLVRYEWHVPRKFPWPTDWHIDLQCDWNSDLSEQYAAFWFQLETSAAEVLRSKGGSVPSQSCGRGQTLKTVPLWTSGVPSKKSREGSLNPNFFGHSLQHCQYFKQLRRLESMKRLTKTSSDSPLHHIKKVELWRAIRNAAGFPKGFGQWWVDHTTTQLQALPCVLPSQDEIEDIFQQFNTFVRAFEDKLIRSRVSMAKKRRQNDLNMVFRDCQSAKPEKVDTIVISEVAEIEEIHPSDVSVVLKTAASFDLSRPVVCKGSALGVIFHDQDQLWLESLPDAQPGDIIRQDQVYSTDHDILQEFCRVWTPRWQKASHVHESQWQQIMAFSERNFAPITWNFDQWDLDKFQKALRIKKSSAATGPDGVSRADLALPCSGQEAMTDLFRAVETKGQWPLQLTRGFVNSLFKNKGNGGVDSYRPVTVYPLPYRIWSSSRAKEAMNSLAPHLPRSVVGGVPARQAKEVWIEVAEVVENAFLSNDPIQGLVVDICRAFNGIPRIPLWHLLTILNFSRDILGAWSNFVSVQERMFRVRHSTSNPIGSTVGYPEGCAFSVFAMTLVDMMLDRWLYYATHGNHCLYAYVDDWHVTFPPAVTHVCLWNSVTDFADCLELQIDGKKSFLWASHSEERKTMRSQADLAVVLAAKDLGAHHNFCRKPGNASLIERLGSMDALWVRLSVCHSPIRLKMQALVQLAWPKAFYGVAIVHVGDCHYKVLRTGALKGLRCGRVGANPVLHLSAAGILHDPEAYVIFQTLRELREVGNISQSKLMLSLVQSRCTMEPRNGPGQILWSRLNRLGWAVTAEGGAVDTISPFCVFSTHRDELLFRIVHAWPRVLAAEVYHRPSFAGIQQADIPALKRAMTEFGEADREFLKCALDGTLYIDVGRSKQEREGPRVCKFCQAPDSFYHRIWECPNFASCRSKFPYTHLLSELPPCLINHGWPTYPSEWLRLLEYFADLRMHCVLPFPVQWPTNQVLELFTDGACAHPTKPKLRFAAYAVTLALGGIGSLDHVVVGAGHVPGIIQTAYRAELLAMVRAFEVVGQLGRVGRIWSDNLAVCRRARKILEGWVPKRTLAHFDLLDRLVELVREFDLGNKVSVVKVVSHASLLTAEDDLQHWAFWRNNLVDAAADYTNNSRPSIFWKLWQDAAIAVETSESIHAEILKVLVQVARFQPTTKETGSYETPEETCPQPEVQPLTSEHVLSMRVTEMYGQLNMSHIDRWWRNVGERSLKSRGRLCWVAGLHLYIDFFWTTEFQGVISPKFGQWFSDPSEVPGLQLNLSSRTTMFLRAWNAYMKDRHQYIPRKLTRPRSSVLACWVQSYRLPWSFQRLDAIDKALMAAFGRQVVKGVQISTLVTLSKHPEETLF